jgi:hypothetical protein
MDVTSITLGETSIEYRSPIGRSLGGKTFEKRRGRCGNNFKMDFIETDAGL